jgi:hypothetical protein
MTETTLAGGVAARAALWGGQPQRVAWPAGLAARSQIIFADEPIRKLDSRSGGEILSTARLDRVGLFPVRRIGTEACPRTGSTPVNPTTCRRCGRRIGSASWWPA